jgi:hypothetical protein
MNRTASPSFFLKLLGLFLIVEGVAGALAAAAYSIMIVLDETTYSGASTLASPASNLVWSAIKLLLGLYFFFSAHAIAARICPEP